MVFFEDSAACLYASSNSIESLVALFSFSLCMSIMSCFFGPQLDEILRYAYTVDDILQQHRWQIDEILQQH